ncbi:MAG: hypothetical protein GY699_24040 [Desulfobacteraceae bacterium]|nr:hypothetical protein [Desulfobacteraceae bacterium]
MKTKKIVMFLVFISVVCVGSYLFHKNKSEKTLLTHNNSKFQRMTLAAKKSATAGMLVMAAAVNKFHKEKGHYPKALLDLYPNFIMDKSFISTLNWKYYPKNGSYLIKRNIKGKKKFASIGPKLKLKTGIIDSIVLPKAVASPTPKFQKTKTVKTVALKNAKTETDNEKYTKLIQEVEKKSSSNIKKGLKNKSQKKSTQSDPSTIIVKKALNDDEKYLLSFKGNGLYIWKTKNGIIGFSDIQYPDKVQLTIYKDRSWIKYIDNQNVTVKN